MNLSLQLILHLYKSYIAIYEELSLQLIGQQYQFCIAEYVYVSRSTACNLPGQQYQL